MPPLGVVRVALVLTTSTEFTIYTGYRYYMLY